MTPSVFITRPDMRAVVHGQKKRHLMAALRIHVHVEAKKT